MKYIKPGHYRRSLNGTLYDLCKQQDGQWCLKRDDKEINQFRTVCAAEAAFDRLEREEAAVFSQPR